MNTTQERLAKRLLYLPLDIHEKVLLWLAYRGLKPVSEITVTRRNIALFRRLIRQGKKIKSTYDSNSPKTKRVRKWIRDANLFYATEPGYPIAWHIGRNNSKVRRSARLLHRFDYKSEYQSGILFGFPKESAKAYAHNRITKDEKKLIPMVSPFRAEQSFLKNKYYKSYAFYAIRADRVEDESRVAKLWADTIRKEIPLLAKWFENHQRKIK